MRTAMRTLGARRCFTLLAVVPLLVALGSTPSSQMFVCRGDSLARQTCCCAHGGTVQVPPAQNIATLTNACCCRLGQRTVSVAPALASARGGVPNSSRILEAATTLRSVLGVPVYVEAEAIAWRLAHPPPTAVPILVGKQTFLI